MSIPVSISSQEWHVGTFSCIFLASVNGVERNVFEYLTVAAVSLSWVVKLCLADDVKDVSFYTYGIKDMFAVFFYGLICIVFHAVFQEYIFDVSW